MSQNTPAFGYSKTDLSNTAVLVRTGSGRITTMELRNINTADAFVQFFDAAAAADVTVGSTSSIPFFIPGSDGTNRSSNAKDFGDRGFFFRKGLVIAATTSETNGTAPSSAISLTLTIA